MPRTIKEQLATIHELTFKDILASYLYMTNLVEDDDEILEVTLGNPSKGIYPIAFKTIKNREVDLIVHS